jgi:hypothetical protein
MGPDLKTEVRLISKPTCCFASSLGRRPSNWRVILGTMYSRVQVSAKKLRLLSIINGLPWKLRSLAASVLLVSEWLFELTLRVVVDALAN